MVKNTNNREKKVVDHLSQGKNEQGYTINPDGKVAGILRDIYGVNTII
ncbi:MAG: hypothetical protein AVDCRST_MAG96-2667 [uncultured Segetibacter sp.]|uniref:Uncharacterized protein n=1 Tax=uncultured Segetibacter sp. TaxID=481133 RepID=A0A6J4T807_9BACT|nr:MAG: hypothetical protein AVDCRST_MAG96-2667 [uncultured Segetibacter sp.]